ncbi:MAG: hypothetical protein Q9M19_07740 [Mariprofundaceae bacterium]|nr:hypothetical protein [Mariprofundaceae bacterium]
MAEQDSLSAQSLTPRSKRYLLVIFLLVLPVMLLLRWDASTWLSAQVDAMIEQSAMDLHYSKVELAGLGVRLHDIRVQRADLVEINVETVVISLSLTHLLTGTLAADVDMLWFDNTLSGSVYQSDEHIYIEDIAAEVDWLKLLDVQQQLPFRASGVMHVVGDVAWHKNTGKPVSGKLELGWTDAMLGLATPEFALGDYVLDVYSDSSKQATWQWHIQGGKDVALAGEGMFYTTQALLQQWTMTGVLDVNIDASNATLSMMGQAFTGSNQAKIRLSGPLLRPQTQVIR